MCVIFCYFAVQCSSVNAAALLWNGSHSLVALVDFHSKVPSEVTLSIFVPPQVSMWRWVSAPPTHSPPLVKTP